MARSDHSDVRAVPVDSDSAGFAAQRLVIGLHARRGAAREPTQSHLLRTVHTANISAHTPHGRFERCDARARPRWLRPRRWPIGETARELAVRLAERRPLLLLVDDAHRADVSSLRFLAHLRPRISDVPLGVVVGARPADRGADGVLSVLAADPATRLLRLRPLSSSAGRQS